MSYTSLAYHIVFSTKERRPMIAPEILPRLIQYFGGLVRNLEGQMIEANGPENHFHILAILSHKIAVADCLREIKSRASGWVHETFAGMHGFGWQDGYSAFTVSRSAIPEVARYVRIQQEHHKTMTFEEELVRMLKKHGIKYDERYVFG